MPLTRRSAHNPQAAKVPSSIEGARGPEPAPQRGAYCPYGLSLLLAPVGTANHSQSRVQYNPNSRSSTPFNALTRDCVRTG